MKRLACLLTLLVACGKVSNDDGGGGGSDAGSDGQNDPPTDIEISATTVEEQAPPGTRVGLLTAVDPDASDHHTFELTDDGDGQFAIDGAALAVAPDAILNYETGATVTVTVKATDEAGESVEKDLEVEILDLREVVNTVNSGDGSLRQAIADAEPGETILFATGLDSTIAVNGTLLLTKNVTIRGPLPPAEIVLDALGNNRVFDVSPAVTVTLENLRIRGGTSTTSGAIQNEGVLTVDRCIFEDNLADSFGRGGAISNSNTLVARDSLFQRNRGYNGGAIAADGAGGTTIERCTFQDNATTGNSGGAIVGGHLKILNSTFSGNAASDPSLDRVGGAIGVFYPDNEIAFSTFAGNTADGLGGGIYCQGSDDPVALSIRGSLLAGNDAPTGPDIDIGTGCTLTPDHDLVSRAGGSTVSSGEGGSVINTAVSVGALGDNGGLTPTFVPESGAASIDLVPAASCSNLAGDPLDEDQRGEPRPAGDACDAGSVEQ
jgi:predicted outer membrane repeat protein